MHLLRVAWASESFFHLPVATPASATGKRNTLAHATRTRYSDSLLRFGLGKTMLPQTALRLTGPSNISVTAPHRGTLVSA